jgi:hypothetical protein
LASALSNASLLVARQAAAERAVALRRGLDQAW